MIIYFSGTGNSRYAAKKIAAVCEEELLNLAEVLRGERNAELTGEKKLVFVVPTYAYRIPRVVSAWIEKTAFPKGTPVWFVMTCGGGIGNADKYNRELCGKKALRYMGTAQIVMPENYITMFKAPTESETRRIIERAEPYIRKAGEAVAKGRELKSERVSVIDKALSTVVNRTFYPLAVNDRAYYAKDTCTACGKCVKLCPMSNIELENGKPCWKGNCTQCMACICACPAEAIEYGKKTRGKRRYYLK